MYTDMHKKGNTFGMTLVYNDENRATKPKSKRDDWDNMLTHRNGKALGAVVLKNSFTAKNENGYVTFYKNDVEIDEADHFDVIDVIDGYHYIEGAKNIYIIANDEAIRFGFKHESVNDLLDMTLSDKSLIDFDLTGHQMDVLL